MLGDIISTDAIFKSYRKDDIVDPRRHDPLFPKTIRCMLSGESGCVKTTALDLVVDIWRARIFAFI